MPAKHMGVVRVHHPLHHHGDACHAIHHGRACEVTSLFKQRSLRNEFTGFGVFLLNPVGVWHAWCLIVTSMCLMPCLVIRSICDWRVPLWGAPLSPRQLSSDI